MERPYTSPTVSATTAGDTPLLLFATTRVGVPFDAKSGRIAAIRRNKSKLSHTIDQPLQLLQSIGIPFSPSTAAAAATFSHPVADDRAQTSRPSTTAIGSRPSTSAWSTRAGSSHGRQPRGRASSSYSSGEYKETTAAVPTSFSATQPIMPQTVGPSPSPRKLQSLVHSQQHAFASSSSPTSGPAGGLANLSSGALSYDATWRERLRLLEEQVNTLEHSTLHASAAAAQHRALSLALDNIRLFGVSFGTAASRTLAGKIEAVLRGAIYTNHEEAEHSFQTVTAFAHEPQQKTYRECMGSMKGRLHAAEAMLRQMLDQQEQEEADEEHKESRSRPHPHHATRNNYQSNNSTPSSSTASPSLHERRIQSILAREDPTSANSGGGKPMISLERFYRQLDMLSKQLVGSDALQQQINDLKQELYRADVHSQHLQKEKTDLQSQLELLNSALMERDKLREEEEEDDGDFTPTTPSSPLSPNPARTFGVARRGPGGGNGNRKNTLILEESEEFKAFWIKYQDALEKCENLTSQLNMSQRIAETYRNKAEKYISKEKHDTDQITALSKRVRELEKELATRLRPLTPRPDWQKFKPLGAEEDLTPFQRRKNREFEAILNSGGDVNQEALVEDETEATDPAAGGGAPNLSSPRQRNRFQRRASFTRRKSVTRPGSSSTSPANGGRSMLGSKSPHSNNRANSAVAHARSQQKHRASSNSPTLTNSRTNSRANSRNGSRPASSLSTHSTVNSPRVGDPRSIFATSAGHAAASNANPFASSAAAFNFQGAAAAAAVPASAGGQGEAIPSFPASMYSSPLARNMTLSVDIPSDPTVPSSNPSTAIVPLSASSHLSFEQHFTLAPAHSLGSRETSQASTITVSSPRPLPAAAHNMFASGGANGPTEALIRSISATSHRRKSGSDPDSLDIAEGGAAALLSLVPTTLTAQHSFFPKPPGNHGVELIDVDPKIRPKTPPQQFDENGLPIPLRLDQTTQARLFALYVSYQQMLTGKEVSQERARKVIRNLQAELRDTRDKLKIAEAYINDAAISSLSQNGTPIVPEGADIPPAVPQFPSLDSTPNLAPAMAPPLSPSAASSASNATASSLLLPPSVPTSRTTSPGLNPVSTPLLSATVPSPPLSQSQQLAMAIQRTKHVTKYFIGLGESQDIPPYLRAIGKVHNRNMGKKECETLLKQVMAARKESLVAQELKNKQMGLPPTSPTHASSSTVASPSFSSGFSTLVSTTLPSQHLRDFFYDFLKKKCGVKSLIVEYGYSMVDALERYRWDADCELFSKMLKGQLNEGVYNDQNFMIERLLALCHKLDVALYGAQNLNSLGKPQPVGKVPKPLLLYTLKNFFPLKSNKELSEINKCLNQDQPGSFVVYSKLFEENASGDQGFFAEKIRDSHLIEIEELMIELQDRIMRHAANNENFQVSLSRIREIWLNLDSDRTKADVESAIACALEMSVDLLATAKWTTMVQPQHFFTKLFAKVVVKKARNYDASAKPYVGSSTLKRASSGSPANAKGRQLSTPTSKTIR